MKSDETPRFDDEHRAIMWISTKGLNKGEEDLIVGELENRIAKSNNDKIFIGHCFGRYDLILEFVEESAKVASNLVCEIQNDLSKKLLERMEKDLREQILTPLCSSLSICNKVYRPDVGDNISREFPLRAYTYLCPKKMGVDLKALLENLDGQKEIFWNSSSYSFLLTTNGSTLHDVFRKILEFRTKTYDYFSESCTYFGLAYHEKDTACNLPIGAKVFVKLRDGFGGLDLSPEDKKMWKVEQRLGWSDLSLELINPPYTLRDLKNNILNLRENYSEYIENTSTLLFPKKEGGDGT